HASAAVEPRQPIGPRHETDDAAPVSRTRVNQRRLDVRENVNAGRVGGMRGNERVCDSLQKPPLTNRKSQSRHGASPPTSEDGEKNSSRTRASSRRELLSR